MEPTAQQQSPNFATGDKDFHCDVVSCAFKAMTRGSLYTHKYNQHRLQAQQKKKFKCATCTKGYDSKWRFKNHLCQPDQSLLREDQANSNERDFSNNSIEINEGLTQGYFNIQRVRQIEGVPDKVVQKVQVEEDKHDQNLFRSTNQSLRTSSSLGKINKVVKSYNMDPKRQSESNSKRSRPSTNSNFEQPSSTYLQQQLSIQTDQTSKGVNFPKSNEKISNEKISSDNASAIAAAIREEVMQYYEGLLAEERKQTRIREEQLQENATASTTDIVMQAVHPEEQEEVKQKEQQQLTHSSQRQLTGFSRDLNTERDRARTITVDKYQNQARLTIKGKNYNNKAAGQSNQYCSLTQEQWQSFCDQAIEIIQALQCSQGNSRQKIFKIYNKELSIESYKGHRYVKIVGQTINQKSIMTLNLVELNQIFELKEEINAALFQLEQQKKTNNKEGIKEVPKKITHSAQLALLQSNDDNQQSSTISNNNNHNTSRINPLATSVQWQQQQSLFQVVGTAVNVKDAKDIIIEDLRRQVKDLKEKLENERQARRLEVKQLREQLDNERLIHKQELKEQRESYERQLREQRLDFERQLREQREYFERYLKEQKGSYERQLKEQREYFERFIAELQRDKKSLTKTIQSWQISSQLHVQGNTTCQDFKSEVERLSSQSSNDNESQSSCIHNESQQQEDEQMVQQQEQEDKEQQWSSYSKQDDLEQSLSNQNEEKKGDEQSQNEEDNAKFDLTGIAMQIFKKVRRNEVAQLGFSNAHIDLNQVPDSVCLTYSELTGAAVRKIIQAINELEVVEEDYFKLSRDSHFLDIGSGLGFIIYQIAFTIKCKAMGIEFDEHKVKLADETIRAMFEKNIQILAVETNQRNQLCNFLKLVSFEQGDVTQIESFSQYTHLYSFNPTWHQSIIDKVIEVINKSKDVRILVWNMKPQYCQDLIGFEFVKQIEKCATVVNEQFTFYLYKKMKSTNSLQQQIESKQAQQQLVDDQKIRPLSNHPRQQQHSASTNSQQPSSSLQQQQILNLSSSGSQQHSANLHDDANYNAMIDIGNGKKPDIEMVQSQQKKAPFELVSLKNQVNTCYLNAELQLLSYVVYVVHGQQLFLEDGGLDLYNFYLSTNLQNIDRKQRDAEEYFRISAEKIKQLDGMLIQQTTLVQCQTCLKDDQEQESQVVSLDLPVDQSTFSDNLRILFNQVNTLEDQACIYCKEKDKLTKKIVYHEYQDCVLVQYLRFDSATGKKLTKGVKNDKIIQLNKRQYKLLGYVTHLGESLNSGHYITVIDLSGNGSEYWCHDDLKIISTPDNVFAPQSPNWFKLLDKQEKKQRSQSYFLIYVLAEKQEAWKFSQQIIVDKFDSKFLYRPSTYSIDKSQLFGQDEQVNVKRQLHTEKKQLRIVGPVADSLGNAIYGTQTSITTLKESVEYPKVIDEQGFNVYDKNLEGDLYRDLKYMMTMTNHPSKQEEYLSSNAGWAQLNRIQSFIEQENIYQCYTCAVNASQGANTNKNLVGLFDNQEQLRMHQQATNHGSIGLLFSANSGQLVNVLGVNQQRKKQIMQEVEDKKLGALRLTQLYQETLKVIQSKRNNFVGQGGAMATKATLEKVITDSEGKLSPAQLSEPSNPRCRKKKQLGKRRNRKQVEIEGKKKTEGRELRNQQKTKVVDFLKQEEDVQQYIKDFDKVFDELFTKNEARYQNGDKFEIVGRLFTDGFKVNKCRFFTLIEQPIEWLKAQINGYFQVKKIKKSGKDGFQSYFVRITDEAAKIDEEFLQKFKQMMHDIRIAITRQCEVELQLSNQEAQFIAEDFFVQQFDHTSHLKGMIYVLDIIQEVLIELAKDLGAHFQRATSHQFKSSKSCLQFIKMQRQRIKQRLKFYNKFPMHLLQTESLEKVISMGLKALLYGSSEFIYTIRQCKGYCLSRMEFSEMFDSLEEEQSYFSQKGLYLSLQRLHRETLDNLNKSTQIQKVYRRADMEEVLDAFFSNVEHSVIIRAEDECVIIYGYNNDTKKYYGLLDKIPFGKTLEELAIHHQFPTSLGICYWLCEKKRYKKEIYKKDQDRGEAQFPIHPLCHSHKQQNQLDFLNFDKHGLVYKVNTETSQVQLVESTSNISSHQQRVFNRKLDNDIYFRYKQHNAKVKQLDEAIAVKVSFNLLAWNKNMLIAYCDLKKTKYQLRLDKETFLNLKSHLIGYNFKHRNNICVRPKGISNKDLQLLLQKCLEHSSGESSSEQELEQQQAQAPSQKKKISNETLKVAVTRNQTSIKSQMAIKQKETILGNEEQQFEQSTQHMNVSEQQLPIDKSLIIVKSESSFVYNGVTWFQPKKQIQIFYSKNQYYKIQLSDSGEYYKKFK